MTLKEYSTASVNLETLSDSLNANLYLGITYNLDINFYNQQTLFSCGYTENLHCKELYFETKGFL